MRDLFILLIHLFTTAFRLAKPGGVRTLVAESVLVKYQLLIGTVRRECLDRTLFWTMADLEAKLIEFQHYYNAHRVHRGLGGKLPDTAGR
jgi:hypothetical protein